MEIFKLGKETAQKIENYDSIFAFYSKLMRTETPTNIGFIQGESLATIKHQYPNSS